MASARIAWGIDVGNRALKAVRVSRGAEGVRIDDYVVIEHEHILSNAGDNRESYVQNALAAFTQQHQTKGAPVGVGVSGQSSFARFVKLPPVEKKKIPEIVRFEAIQQIPFPLDDVEWSYELFEDEGSPDVEVGIFAMRKELVNQHIANFTSVGLNVQVVQMNPLAVYNGLKFDDKLKGASLIIDLGAENADLIITEGEGIWMRSVPIGGNAFTEALAKQFKLRFEKAEELKRNAATSKYGRQILQAMRPVFADLVSEIQRSIGFYSSVHRDSRIARVIALGGTFKLPGLQKYLQQNLQLEVHKLDSLGQGPPPDAATAAALSENLLSSVSAYGLALQALGDAKITSSLLPQAIRREKEWRGKTKWFAAAAACFVAGTSIAAAGYFTSKTQYEDQSKVREDITRTFSQAKTRDAQWKRDVEGAGTPDRKTISDVKSLLAFRGLWASLQADVTAPFSPPAVAGDVARLKQVPRNQRRTIELEDMEVRYLFDINPVLAMDDPSFNGQMTPKSLTGIADLRAKRAAGTPGGYGSPMMPSSPMMAPRMPMGVPGMMPGAPGMPGMRPMTPSPAPSAASAAGGDTNAPPAQRGFLITLHCSTPFENGPQIVNENVVEALRKQDKALQDKALAAGVARRNYKIARITIPNYLRLRDDTERLRVLTERARNEASRKAASGGGEGLRPELLGSGASGFSGGTQGSNPFGVPGGAMSPFPGAGMVPGRGFIPGMPAGQAVGPDGKPIEVNLLVDPITGEDIRNDASVVVLVAVMLDAPVVKPEAAGAEGAPPKSPM